jgi:hypothetical protein
MPRGPSAQWRARKEPVSDHYLLASVTQAGGIGKHDERGAYAELVVKGLADREEAAEWKRSLHRCAVFMHRNGIADISVSTKVERAGKGYQLRFTVWNKTHSRAYVMKTYGPDRSLWPYDPRRRGGNE